jgi:hypothetical protein
MSASGVSPLYAVLSHLVGSLTTVTLKGGRWMTGLLSFETLLHPDSRQIVIELAKDNTGELHFDPVRIDFDKIEKIEGSSAGGSGPTVSTEFKTDSGITTKHSPTSRVLQPWQGEKSGDSSAIYSLGYSEGNSKWDQFSANQRLFGVTVSYDESQYTTPINRSSPDYLKRAEHAENIARDIETKNASGFNMATDRARNAEQMGDEEDDEEALYSQVKREPEKSPQAPVDQKPKPKPKFNINAAAFVPSSQSSNKPQNYQPPQNNYSQEQPYNGTVYFYPPSQYYYQSQQMPSYNYYYNDQEDESNNQSQPKNP